MRRMSRQWRMVMVVVTFCLMFGGAAIAPTAVGAYSANVYQSSVQGSTVYLPPSPCRVYYAAY